MIVGPRIVVLSYCYPPMPHPQAVQVGRFVEHMVDREVVVVCGAEPGSAATAVPVGREVRRRAWTPVQVFRRRLLSVGLGSSRLATDLYGTWARQAARHIEVDVAAADVLVTFGQPMSDHVAGLRVAARSGCAWVAHFSDPWIDNPFEQRTRRAVRRGRRLERAVLLRADRVVFTSEETARLVMAAHPEVDYNKVRVLPHSFDPSLYPSKAGPPESGPLVLRHVGSFYGPRSPMPLVRALSDLLVEDPELEHGVRVELVGSMPPDVRDEVRAVLPEKLVSIVPPVPYRDSLALMSRAHLLLVVDAPADESVFLPSKLVDYIGSGRPILALTPPGASRALVEAHGGWCADPRDRQACAAALRDALAAIRATGAKSWGRADLRADLRADAVTARLIMIVDEAVTSRHESDAG